MPGRDRTPPGALRPGLVRHRDGGDVRVGRGGGQPPAPRCRVLGPCPGLRREHGERRQGELRHDGLPTPRGERRRQRCARSTARSARPDRQPRRRRRTAGPRASRGVGQRRSRRRGNPRRDLGDPPDAHQGVRLVRMDPRCDRGHGLAPDVVPTRRPRVGGRPPLTGAARDRARRRVPPAHRVPPPGGASRRR